MGWGKGYIQEDALGRWRYHNRRGEKTKSFYGLFSDSLNTCKGRAENVDPSFVLITYLHANSVTFPFGCYIVLSYKSTFL